MVEVGGRRRGQVGPREEGLDGGVDHALAQGPARPACQQPVDAEVGPRGHRSQPWYGVGDPGGDPGLAHTAADQRQVRAGGPDAHDHGVVQPGVEAFGDEQPSVAGDAVGVQRGRDEQDHVRGGGNGDDRAR